MSERRDVTRMRQLLRDRPLSDGQVRDDVPVEQLERLLDGELDGAEAEALARRLTEDADLALRLRLLRELRAALGQPRSATDTGDTTDAAPPADRRPLWTVLGAMAAAAAALLFIREPSLEHPGSEQLRSGAPAGPIESAIPSASLPRDAFVIEWAGGPPGATYDLFVTTASLRSIHRAYDLETSAHTVPREALAGLSAGTPLLWRVVAVAPDGRRAQSAAFEIVLR